MFTNIHFLERKTIRYFKYVRRMMRYHFNEEFQKSPHDFDDFFSNQRCTTFFSDSYESKFMHQGGKLGRRL